MCTRTNPTGKRARSASECFWAYLLPFMLSPKMDVRPFLIFFKTAIFGRNKILCRINGVWAEIERAIERTIRMPPGKLSDVVNATAQQATMQRYFKRQPTASKQPPITAQKSPQDIPFLQLPAQAEKEKKKVDSGWPYKWRLMEKRRRLHEPVE